MLANSNITKKLCLMIRMEGTNGGSGRCKKGSTILSKWEFLAWRSSAEEAEAKACISDLNLLIQLQCTSSTVETDFRRTVEVMVKGEPDKSVSWPIYLEG
jgi:hypothetical protein